MTDPVKFLLVDDVDDNLVALSGLLERPGVELHTARSGVEALDRVLDHDFALVLLDVQMPGMDGFEVAELMRGAERSRHVPIIFITAGAREPHRVFKGYESGAVDFLFKPIDPGILQHKAGVFFELYRQRQQLARQVTEREQMLARLSETLRLNETFAAVLGHDLRNPLSAIMAGATLLAHRSSDAPTTAVANRILASGSRMGVMIEQLLDLSRARLGGGISIARAEVDLRAVAEKVAAELRDGHPDRTLSLEAAGDLHGSWDAPRLAQALSNLAANALQHGDGGGPVCVLLDGRDPDTVSVCVKNAGVIAPAALEHLFEPFRPGRGTRPGSRGLGLGLYIVDQIVKAHEGAIHVGSTAADGTIFEVRLPRTPAGGAALGPRPGHDRGDRL
ncbi:MAG: hybrid sensor histidine kinase/response regulator [Acidobacteria bacterium]|nr:hybrid sensor histidine kinase/response regulator [Acidobacteriota bacterium]